MSEKNYEADKKMLQQLSKEEKNRPKGKPIKDPDWKRKLDAMIAVARDDRFSLEIQSEREN